MENDLISRSALLDEIYGSNRPEVYDGQDIANWQMECINSAPAVDAEPVRHGRWEHGMQCSFCKQIDTTKPNYCPNCGTRMDGDKYATD